MTIQMDYAENLETKYQNEPSSMYYDKSNTTLHPMVVQFKRDMEELTARSFVGVTREMAHTVPTHYSFITQLLNNRKEVMPDLRLIHFITDSPSSQYRNRTIVNLVARFPTPFNMDATWTWLESGHGKRPCSGLGGGVKRKADNLIKSGVVIRDATVFCKHLSESSSNVQIFEVSPATIKKNKAAITKWNAPAVQHISAAYCIIPSGAYIMMREAACFEDCCYEQGGIFHPTCDGWVSTGVQVQRPSLADTPTDTPQGVEQKVTMADLPTPTPLEQEADMPTPTPLEQEADMPTPTPLEKEADMPSPTPLEQEADLPTPTPLELEADMPTPTPLEQEADMPTPTPLEQEADLPTPTPLEPTVIVADTPTTTEIKPKNRRLCHCCLWKALVCCQCCRARG